MSDFPYEDIINLPAPELKTRPPMNINDRAAQFSPFAAVVGHDAAIAETARLTEAMTELDEYEKSEINGKLQYINDNITDCPEVVITYFKPDDKKDGGTHITVTGTVKKIKEFERLVVMDDGTEIPIDDIRSLESNIHIFNLI